MHFVRIGRFYINLDKVEFTERYDEDGPLVLCFSQGSDLWLRDEEIEVMEQYLSALTQWTDR